MRIVRITVLLLWSAALGLAACAGARPARPPSAELDELTPRERRDFEQLTRRLSAPCLQTPMTVEQCSRSKAVCPGCVAASKFLAKAVRDGRSRAQIEAAYEKRFEQSEPKPIDLSEAPVHGNPAAPVTVVEFADFECPACSSMVGLLDGLVRDFPEHVKVSFKHYPLTYHPNAELAAHAAVAAQQQGKFWEMHHKMYQNQRALTLQDLEGYARELGLDLERFRVDLTSAQTAARVKREYAEGTRIGVKGTPTVFIDGRQFNTQLFDTASELTDWVQGQIEIKTGQWVEPRGAVQASGSAAYSSEPPPARKEF
jgi:protein-disulfide isomerase